MNDWVSWTTLTWTWIMSILLTPIIWIRKWFVRRQEKAFRLSFGISNDISTRKKNRSNIFRSVNFLHRMSFSSWKRRSIQRCIQESMSWKYDVSSKMWFRLHFSRNPRRRVKLYQGFLSHIISTFITEIRIISSEAIRAHHFD